MSEIPLWVEIPCLTIWGIVVIWIIRGIYRNYLINVFARKKRVKAELISKAAEEYYETRFYANSPGRSIGSPTSGMRPEKSGIAYRLYFRVQDKNIELDVDQAIFDDLPETGNGVLEYKGNMFYSFQVEK